MNTFGRLVSCADIYSGKFNCDRKGLNFEQEREKARKALNTSSASLLYPQNYEADQQKRALDKLVDEKYNKIHEDAFNKIAGLDGRQSTTSRLRDIIQRLWCDKNRHIKIIKGLESQVKDALETCERQRRQLEIQASEIKKMRASKGNYGKA